MRIRFLAIRPFVALLALLLVIAVAGSGQLETESPLVRLERTISSSHALPGSQLLVTLRIEAFEDLAGVGIRETLPYGWTIHPLENEGAAFKRSENEWVFPEGIEAGGVVVLTYEVTTATADRLLSVTLPSCFEITGIFQASQQGLEIPIPGDTRVELVTALPIPVAVAHLVPESKDEADRIDLRLDRLISKRQLDRAIEWWASDMVVPWTEGERIDLGMIERIIALYETCTPAEMALPQSIDPALRAIRTIKTFLPCDSVVLPEGCLNPGLSARQFQATVQITGDYDAYGVGLAEWFPETWRVTPIAQTGLTYRPSAREWVYPERLVSGETLSVTYLVEVVANTTDPLDESFGCCGADAGFVGFVSSGLECSERDVTGESSVYVWDCLPVLLAISRWDVEADRLDATLSDLITFPQVQRALEFWLSGTAVPHTCGYTVGYHTLKAIIAYWLAGTPVTQSLPGSVASACETSDTGCYAPSCAEGDLCHLSDVQAVEDYVGLAASPQVTVNVEGNCELTCAAPTTMLRMIAHGGTPPYRYEWWNENGDLIGTDESLTVDRPGVYNAIVISVGGCEVGQRVVITGDFEAPQLAIQVSGVISCATPDVTLTSSILGGRAPYRVEWFDEQGSLVGQDVALVVDRAGEYALVVTGANGCESHASAIVVEDRLIPTVDAGADRVMTCEVREVTLAGAVADGREPYTFVWTNEAGHVVGSTAEVTVGAEGRYELTVMGANGCSASDFVTVLLDIEAPDVEVSRSGAITCDVSEVTLRADISGGRAPYRVFWRDSSGTTIGSTAEICVVEPGTYAVRVEGANGCVTERSISVEEDIEPPAVDAGSGKTLTCAVPEATLTVTISGGRAPYEIAWTDSALRNVGSSSSILVNRPDTYTVTVSGANGCRARDTVTVTEDKVSPRVVASVDGVLTCSQKAVSLSAAVSGGRPPYDIVWTDAQGTIVGEATTTAVSAAGTYTVTVVGANGCQAEASITVIEDIATPVVDAGPDMTLTCAAPEATLIGTISGGREPYDVIWRSQTGKDLGSRASLTVDEPGIYTLYVRGANGCAASDAVTVTLDTVAPSVEATASDVLTCAVSTVTLEAAVSGGRQPYEVVWTNAKGATIGRTGSVDVSEPGRYTVTATGANGCCDSATVEVTEDLATPNVEATVSDVLCCAIPVVTLEAMVSEGRAPYAMVWSDADGVTIGTAASVEVGEPGRYTVTATGANGCRDTATVEVTEDVAAPSVEATVSGVLSCAVVTVTLDAVISGGRAPIEIVWTNADGAAIGTAASIEVGEPGRYTVTATGANGCRDTATVEVTEDVAAPNVEATASGVLSCAVNSVPLEATVSGGRAPFDIVWTNADGAVIGTTRTVEVSEPGHYAVTVMGANGCAGSAAIEVTEDVAVPSVEATVSGDLSCSQTAVTLSATVSGGRAPYTCIWSDCCGTDLGTGREYVATLPGAYVITVTGANGCSSRATVEVFEDIEAPTVEATVNEALSCAVSTVTLTATVTGGRSPYSIVWTDAHGTCIGTTATVEVDEPGFYKVSAIGANGCSEDATVEVLEDVAAPSVEAAVSGGLSCSVTQVTLSASVSGGRAPYTYRWTDFRGLVLGCDSSLTVDAPGIYAVAVTGANGCTGTATLDVTEDVEAPAVQVEASGVLTCATPMATLTATVIGGRAPYSIAWMGVDGTPIGTETTVEVSEPGRYTVTVTGANGCSDAATVEVLQDVAAPSVGVTVSGSLSCSVTEVTLSGTVSGGRAPYAYRWTDSCGLELGCDASLTVDVPGAYRVTVTGSNGCTGTATIDVTEDAEAPVVEADASRVLTCTTPTSTLSVTVDGGRSPFAIVWKDPDGATIGTSEMVEVAGPGRYTVTVTGANGCSATTEVEVLLDIAPPSVEATVSGALSCSVTEVLIKALASGGRAPYTFRWTDCCGNPLGTGSELWVTAPGTYRVMATGANGCSSMATIAVTEDIEAPMVEATVSGTLTCSILQVTLSATASGGRPPYTYLWADPDGATVGTSESVTVCESGTYRVTVTGANGCRGAATIAVAEDMEPPLVDLGSDRTLTCAEPKITLSVGACTGCAYVWTNARGETLGTDAYLTVAVAGTYAVTVTGANGCCASDSVVVSNGIQAPSVEIACDVEPIYSGEEIVLEAVATGGATPYTYEWRDACDVVIGTDSTVTIDTPGVYLVIVRSATGCIASDQFEVTAP